MKLDVIFMINKVDFTSLVGCSVMVPIKVKVPSNIEVCVGFIDGGFDFVTVSQRNKNIDRLNNESFIISEVYMGNFQSSEDDYIELNLYTRLCLLETIYKRPTKRMLENCIEETLNNPIYSLELYGSGMIYSKKYLESFDNIIVLSEYKNIEVDLSKLRIWDDDIEINRLLDYLIIDEKGNYKDIKK